MVDEEPRIVQLVEEIDRVRKDFKEDLEVLRSKFEANMDRLRSQLHTEVEEIDQKYPDIDK